MGQALQQYVVDTFRESFREGSGGEHIDARFRAGVFLILKSQLLIILYSVRLGIYSRRIKIILYSECGVCLAMAGLILLIHPNKTNFTHVIHLLFSELRPWSFGVCFLYP